MLFVKKPTIDDKIIFWLNLANFTIPTFDPLGKELISFQQIVSKFQDGPIMINKVCKMKPFLLDMKLLL